MITNLGLALNRVKGSKEKRKQVLRELKKLTAQIGKHGKKHLIKLQESWEESSLSQKQKDCIAQRLDSLLQLEGRIVKQVSLSVSKRSTYKRSKRATF